MPPDGQSNSGMAMLGALMAKTSGGLGAVAGDLLGVKSSGALFIGILRSRTVEDRLIERFDLKKVYRTKLELDARRNLEGRTVMSEDRKSGILTLTVTDNDPKRAAAIAQAYVEELDRLVAQLSTSSARREREFLQERLSAVQVDLGDAEKEFSQFSSRNNAIDIKEQGRAMVEASATLEGQLIAAKSELEGLKQIYTDSNVRVRSTRARIGELQNQLERIGGKGEPAQALRKRLEEFMDQRGISRQGAVFYSHMLPSLAPASWRTNRAAGDGWMAVGDAAGLVDPITGEGIYYALRSADLAARVLLDDSCGADKAAAYNAALSRDFTQDLAYASTLSKRVYRGQFLWGGVPRRMVEFVRRSPLFRETVQDLFSGTQPYLGLRERLYGSLNATLREVAVSFF